MDIMIDIETLDTRPSSLVLTIGAVLFDGTGSSDQFHTALNVDEQVRYGRTMSMATLGWWMKQGSNSAILDQVTKEQRLVGERLREFFNFYTRVSLLERVWANSPSFDITILESLAKDVGLTVPWSYRQLRDVRTLREEARMDRNWTPENWDGTAHDAVNDCLLQIATVIEARRILKG